MKKIIGIDIGGTKISVCIGTNKGEILIGDRLKTKDYENSKHAITSIFRSIKSLLEKKTISIDQIDAIGIACPGPISHVKGMLINPPNLKGWENTPIVDLFEKKFQLPTFMNNDANAAVLAEYDFGAHKKKSSIVYLTASTGMGGGIITNHKLIQGISDTAGEVGHFVLDINGPKCPCGQNGCFEVYCGGRNIIDRIKSDIRKKKISTKILEIINQDIESIDMVTFFKAVKEKDQYAEQVFEEFTIRLSQGIGIIMMTLNPEVIILGTIALYSKKFLFLKLQEYLKNYAWPMAIDKSIVDTSQISEKLSELSGIAVAIYGLENIKVK
jgi:glucokinase